MAPPTPPTDPSPRPTSSPLPLLMPLATAAAGSHGVRAAAPGPPPTLLPDDGPDAAVAVLLRDGVEPADAARLHPASLLAWAVLADRALAAAGAAGMDADHVFHEGADGPVGTGARAGDLGATAAAEVTAQVVAAYAYARTGYHRGLDALRRAGWRGAGPVPWHHEPNRGFLRALAALARAARALGEDDEADRCATFLDACDTEATARLMGAAGGAGGA